LAAAGVAIGANDWFLLGKGISISAWKVRAILVPEVLARLRTAERGAFKR
jgi:hypothetical protein